MFGEGELVEYYKINFLLVNEHNFTLSDIELMTPYEREIYIVLLLEHLEKKKEAMKSGGGRSIEEGFFGGGWQ
jgi:hypothetical protein